MPAFKGRGVLLQPFTGTLAEAAYLMPNGPGERERERERERAGTPKLIFFENGNFRLMSAARIQLAIESFWQRQFAERRR